MDLFPYQEHGVTELLRRKHVLLADEPGLGKTVQVVSALERLHQPNPKLRVLIVSPYSMMDAWRRHFHAWTPSFVHTADPLVTVLDTPQLIHKLRALDDAKAAGHAVIVNYESLVRMIPKMGPDALQFDVLVFDESHRLANRETQTFKHIKKLCHTAPVPPYIWLLTGTPQINKTDDLWTQLHLLDRKRWGSYWRFCESYCSVVKGTYGYEVYSVTDPNDPKKVALARDIEPYILKRTKADSCILLPPKIVSERWAKLSGPIREQYVRLEQDMCLQIEEVSSITVSNVLALILRLRQVLVDPTLMLPRDDPKNAPTSPLRKDSPKLTLLKDVLEGQVDWPIVLFSQFAHVLQRLQNNLSLWGLSSELYTGAVSMQDRNALVERFQETGYPQILLVSTTAGGVGLTLTRASTAIYLDKTWSPAYNVQSQDRIHRVGTIAEEVNIIELLISGTIEERINRLLRNKSAMDMSLWDAMREMYGVQISEKRMLPARGKR